VDLWQRFADGWHDALLAFDRELRLVAVNAPAAALFGAAPDALVGRRLSTVAPAAAAVLEPLAARAFDELSVFANDLRPFGDDEPYSVMTHRLVGDDAIAFNLHRERDGNWPTDEGWAHRELAFANRLLQAYTDNTSLGFVRWDHEFRVVEWSARAAEIFGWTFDDVRGRSFDDFGLVYSPDVPRVAAAGRAMQSESATAGVSENRNVTKDGRVLHCRWFSSRIPIDGSYQIVSLVEDVTDTVRARASALQNEQRFRSVFTNAGDAMMLIDTEGIVTHANAAAQRTFGAPASSLVGRAYADLIADDSGWIGRSSFSRVLLGETVSESLRMRRTDGTTFPVTTSTAPIRVGDRIAGVVTTAKDMSAFVEATASLEASEERFRSIFDYSPEPMLAMSLDGTIVRANAAAAREYGGSVEDLLGHRAAEFLTSTQIEDANRAFKSAGRGTAATLEALALRAHGPPVSVLVTFIPIVFRGTITGVHLVARDLTAVRRAERAVAVQSDRLRELYLVAASSDGTPENLIASTIDAGCRLLRMTAGSLYDAEADRSVSTVGNPIPRRLARLALATDGALALDDLRGVPYLGEPEFGEQPPWAYIGTAIEVGGVRYGSLSFAADEPRAEPFTPSDRDLVQLMGVLVSSAIERGHSRARLKHLAYNDQLTALPNRAWFVERLRDELTLARAAQMRVAVMFLDLDRFKDINDSLGHALGDRMLRVIADRLTAIVGSEGLVARMGGDEFIVLIGNDPATELVDTLARRIIAAIDEPLVIDGYEQFVTTSIGIAIFPDDGDDADALIKHADVAMYRAKERGRNTHQFFTPALAASLRTRLAQEKSLRKGLEREEFVLHYQPQFELDGERLVSVEALVRWQHPTLGLIGPDEFIPSAEMSGLIVDLGDWVLETACRQICAWQAIVPGLRLAVNLSARQFHQTALTGKIREILARTGLQPDQLEVEITESVAMSDAAISVQILEELGRAGVRLAVDDFGTGYSSLGYLRRFPLDSLKIDKSFVREIPVEPDDATIVRTVIGMAHSLGLEVCAEGVETAEQLEFLRAEGCDRVQGYLFGRPMAAEAVEAFLAGRGNRAAVG
jgi:diguanylate cyclase (GGDEF)-like protein/PAS domain S-box-containing protein